MNLTKELAITFSWKEHGKNRKRLKHSFQDHALLDDLLSKYTYPTYDFKHFLSPTILY